MAKNSKEDKTRQNKIKTKYSWRFWFLVSVFMAIIVVIIMLAVLSIKALIQDFQLIFYENKVYGTVTVAEFNGGEWEYDESGTGQRQRFDDVHYIIAFDEEKSEYNQYEYNAKDIITNKKYVGDRYIVLFNNIDKPTLIQEKDIITGNIILFLFSALVILVIILRKKLYIWLIKYLKN